MGKSELAVSTITRLMDKQDRSFAWLSRTTGIPYKRVLAEVKNQTRPISLETALQSAEALNANLTELVAA